MLKRFSVKNFRNFENWLVFDLSNSEQYDFNTEIIKDGLINHSIIYGINGSGKSNLGLAVIDLTCHLLDTPVFYSLGENYLNANSNDKLAHFVYEFLFDGKKIKYEYGKELYNTVIYEKLFVNDKIMAEIDRRENQKASFNIKGTEHLKNDLQDEKISILKYLLFNSVLEKNDENNSIQKMYEFIKGMLFFRSLNRAEFYGQRIDVKRLSDEIIERDKVQDFENFLNEAGVECKLSIIGDQDNQRIAFIFNKKKINFMEVASTGTISLGIFYYWWLKLLDGEIKFAYIDEFDAFYHHKLARLIVKKISKVQCQTVMTTHNTSIISNDLLRPDCYFELSSSIMPISSMTKKELRKAHNIEKIYKGLTL